MASAAVKCDKPAETEYVIIMMAPALVFDFFPNPGSNEHLYSISCNESVISRQLLVLLIILPNEKVLRLRGQKLLHLSSEVIFVTSEVIFLNMHFLTKWRL